VVVGKARVADEAGEDAAGSAEALEVGGLRCAMMWMSSSSGSLWMGL